MKVGDLVQRTYGPKSTLSQTGTIVTCYSKGTPSYKFVQVLWHQSGKTFGISSSKVKVISESKNTSEDR